jgi:hypothetical protein
MTYLVVFVFVFVFSTENACIIYYVCLYLTVACFLPQNIFYILCRCLLFYVYGAFLWYALSDKCMGTINSLLILKY